MAKSRRPGSFLFGGGFAQEKRAPHGGSGLTKAPKGGSWRSGYNYAGDDITDESSPANDREPLYGGGFARGKYGAGDKLGPQYQDREPLAGGGFAKGYNYANDDISDESSPADDREPLASGGEPITSAEKLAGHELMGALGISGGIDGDRNKKVVEVVRALKSLFMIFDAGEEPPAPPPDDGEGEEEPME